MHVDIYWLGNYMNSVLNKFLSLSQNFIKIPTFLTVDLERHSMDMQAQYFFFFYSIHKHNVAWITLTGNLTGHQPGFDVCHLSELHHQFAEVGGPLEFLFFHFSHSLSYCALFIYIQIFQNFLFSFKYL